LIAADKTTNYYKLKANKYKELLEKNITKDYKKVDLTTVNTIEQEAKHIATNLHIEDRVMVTSKREAFLTLKDHKPNFRNNPTARLINPTRSEIGIISKKILDKINGNITQKLELNLWRSTASVLQWFTNIDGNERHSFVTFDVIDFYPSISDKLLSDALEYASKHVPITDNERHIIFHAKKSVLFHDAQTWGKKNAEHMFDVTMGSRDGAETCELVGLYLLSHISKINKSFGLYRDDGLGVIQDTARNIEQIKKKLCKLFAEKDLRITIEANKKVVDFLDVTLDLNNKVHMPYTKPGNKLQYVNKRSNHPPSILRNIPMAINRRLSDLSSNAEIFQRAAPPYQEALKNSEYDFELAYSMKMPQANMNRQRKRKIIWFNPPYSKDVANSIGKQFFSILKSEFPQSSRLYKIFNKNTIKLSYSCCMNIKSIISAHNKKELSTKENSHERLCNCRDASQCPLDGTCLRKSVVYQATVTTMENTPPETYIGVTENCFKTRYANHKTSFNNRNRSQATELSKHIWKLKDKNINYNIRWRIIKQTSGYNINSRRCNLCLWEKYFVIYRSNMASLNKRNELVTLCRHAKRFLLGNIT